jgi:hypothetical protein
MGERLDNSNIGLIGDHLVLYSDPSTRHMLHMSGLRECLPTLYNISRGPYAHSPAPFIEKHREGTLAKLSTLSMRDKIASCRRDVSVEHRWALSPISVISNIGLSLISESPISDWESKVRHYIDIGIKFYPITNIQHPLIIKRGVIAEWYSARFWFQGACFRFQLMCKNFCKGGISERTLMSILEHFRYWNDNFQSDIFVSDIGITDVDVGYRRH